jgi:hypothetical protein
LIPPPFFSIIRENGGASVDVALQLVMPMGIMEALMSLTVGRLIDRQVPGASAKR